MSAAASRLRLGRVRQWSVIAHEIFERFPAGLTVNIENKKTGYSAGYYADIRMRPGAPPFMDYFRVRRGVFQSVSCSRMLAG
jgi:hypothetical protein